MYADSIYTLAKCLIKTPSEVGLMMTKNTQKKNQYYYGMSQTK